MTRTERKQQERLLQKQKKTIMMSEYELAQKMRDKEIESLQKLFGVMMTSLHDEFGWFRGKFKKKRLDRYIDRFTNNLDCVLEGHVGLKDFNEWCEENDIKRGVKKMMEEDL